MVEEAKMGPPLRFQGFSDAWEQRELKEILKVNSGRDYKHLGSGSIPVYGTGGYMLSVNDKLSDKDAIGIGRKGTIDKPQYLKAPFWTVDTLFFMIPLNNFDLQFLYTMTQKINWKKMDESTGVPSLSKAVIEKVKQNIPSYQEQIKIGDFFKQLDDTIALHQRQSDNYKELKKSMLQKMFPQDGEKVPEVRFDGFTEEWERRSLNSIVKRVTRKNKNLESNLPLTISAQHGLVDQNTFFNKQVASKDVSGYYLVKKGEFAYNKSYSSGYPWGAIKRLDNYDMGVLSTLYIVFQPVNIISDFLVAYYDTNLWHKEVSMRAAEGARNHGLLNISAQDFFETELIISANTEEQARIGSYFKQLDDTIALHKQKITYLQILKNSLLNKMFI